MNYLAFCTKGLESIAVEEICAVIPDVTITEIGTKRLVFNTSADFQTITSLRTVDDIGLLITKKDNMNEFLDVVHSITALPFENFRNILRNSRPISDTFSITVGTAGVKNYSSQSIATKLSEAIAKKYQWKYTRLEHTNFDIRIFIDHTIMYVCVRLTNHSMYHRSYRVESQAGSLKPTVAAAMLRLATQGKRDLKIVDNFCGSGTILCESFDAGNDVYGGDIELESVRKTTSNLAHLGFSQPGHIRQMDAIKTNWPDHFFDCAISNLPWDKQIKIASITDLYRQTLQEYKRIVKPHGTLCFLISKPDLFLKHAKKIFSDKHIVTYRLGMLGQTPSLVIIA